MSTWKMAFSSAILAAAVAAPASADDFTKLTLLTFSGPVDVPGITLPAGTYRFSLADPGSGRRVVKVADKDGTKTYGMFLTIPNDRLKPADKPVVLFKEVAAGAPPAVRAWFYPGETYGYEFAYPHNQALKIARATHQSVLSYKGDSAPASTDEGKIASMRSADVGRIDENDRMASRDESASSDAPARDQTPVATAGSPAAATAATPRRQHLPRTGSELPMMALLAGLSLAGGVAVRLVRSTV